jgi:hypothetical protein
MGLPILPQLLASAAECSCPVQQQQLSSYDASTLICGSCQLRQPVMRPKWQQISNRKAESAFLASSFLPLQGSAVKDI